MAFLQLSTSVKAQPKSTLNSATATVKIAKIHFPSGFLDRIRKQHRLSFRAQKGVVPLYSLGSNDLFRVPIFEKVVGQRWIYIQPGDEGLYKQFRFLSLVDPTGHVIESHGIDKDGELKYPDERRALEWALKHLIGIPIRAGTSLTRLENNAFSAYDRTDPRRALGRVQFSYDYFDGPTAQRIQKPNGKMIYDRATARLPGDRYADFWASIEGSPVEAPQDPDAEEVQVQLREQTHWYREHFASRGARSTNKRVIGRLLKMERPVEFPDPPLVVTDHLLAFAADSGDGHKVGIAYFYKRHRGSGTNSAVWTRLGAVDLHGQVRVDETPTTSHERVNAMAEMQMRKDKDLADLLAPPDKKLTTPVLQQ